MRRLGRGVCSALGTLYDSLPLKAPVLSLLRPLGLPHGVYQHLHFTGEFKVRTPVRPFWIQHYGYEVENELFWEGLPGRRERISTQLWMELSQRANIVFDVGANTGVYSLIAKAMNPSARVFGFEPVHRVFEKFHRNCTLNHFDIVAMPVALSNRGGTALLYDHPGDHVYSASLNPPVSPQGSQLPVEVSVQTLESIIHDEALDRVDLIKLDVEAHEPEVLEGMGPRLAEFRPTFLIEILSDEVGRRVEKLMAPLSYLYFDIDESGPPRRVSHITRGAKWNYLLCQPTVAAELKLP